jgi:Protein of unknown function (DUF3800)
MIQTIYCDESGFTGNNLSDKDQPLFVYTSIALNPQRAAELVAQVMRDFRLQAAEIKGSRLLKSLRGRKAISFLLGECLTVSQSVVFNKKYALACKLFEYIVEPAISDKNWIFYNLKFHKFVSTLLYAELCIKSAPAEDLLVGFEQSMRSQSAENLDSLFAQRTLRRRTRSVAKEIVTFWHAQQKAVTEEFTTIKSTGATGRWTLDLTDTALFSLLCHWGQKFDQLDVFCDDSMPLCTYLKENGLFAVMIGREDKQFITVADEQHCITFNLLRPVALVNSKTTPGIQVADAIGASIAFALQNPEDPTAKEWLSRLFSGSAISPASMVPDADDADVSTMEGARNRALFFELIRRCREGEGLLDNIEDFISFGWMASLRRGRRRSRRDE